MAVRTKLLCDGHPRPRCDGCCVFLIFQDWFGVLKGIRSLVKPQNEKDGATFFGLV